MVALGVPGSPMRQSLCENSVSCLWGGLFSLSCVNTSATQSYQDICNLASRRASVARYAKLARRGANGLVRPLSTSISRT